MNFPNRYDEKKVFNQYLMLRENAFLVSKHIVLFFANFASDTFVCYRMLTKYLEFYDIRATGLYFSNK